MQKALKVSVCVCVCMCVCIYIYWEGVLKIFQNGGNPRRSSPNLDLLCVQQSDVASFCENYAKLYFDAKHLEKGLNRGW